MLCTFLAVDLGIPVMSRWTRALRLPTDHSALCVEPANTVLQARIRADSIFAATFVRLAIVIPMTLQLIALLARLTLETFWTETHCPVIGHAAQRVNTTGRTIGGARIFALATNAG